MGNPTPMKRLFVVAWPDDDARTALAPVDRWLEGLGATQFAHGSFVPAGAEPHVDSIGDVTWLSTHGPDGYETLELDPDDFDIVFAYPWPGEEQVIFDIFQDCAAVGTLLLTYHGQEGLRLKRKVRR